MGARPGALPPPPQADRRWPPQPPQADTLEAMAPAAHLAISASQAGVSGSQQLSITAIISGSLTSSGSAATVTLSGGASASTSADTGGNYTFGGLANGTYTITPTKTGVTFNPTSQTITISGSSSTGVNFGIAQGQLTPAPTSIPFGNVAVGSTGAQSLTVQNTGTASATISQINVSGSAFSLTGVTLPVMLSAGQGVTYTAQFSPSSGSSFSGSVSVVSNAINTPLTIGLTGTGVAQLTISPTSLSFGSLLEGNSTSLPATLGAQGGNVTVSSATVTGSSYSLTGLTFPLTITAGQTASFSVTFNPKAAGSLPGSIAFVSNSTTSPTSISLSGTGTAPQHSVALTWVASTSTVSGYHVYRGTQSGGPYTLISSGLVSVLTYTDSTVQAGATYFYVVTAVDSGGNESAFSNEVQAVIPTP